MSNGLEVVGLLNGRSLDHPKSASLRPLKSWSDLNLDVVAKPRQHPQQLVEGTGREAALKEG
jgi:hypothetical protein